MEELEPLWTWHDYPKELLGVTLNRTGACCPEQYDIFLDGTQIGYLRLRHGRFTASYPDYMGFEVYCAHPIGDGMFLDDERTEYLTQAIKTLKQEHEKAAS